MHQQEQSTPDHEEQVFGPEVVETIEKAGLKSQQLEDLFHKTIVKFKLRWSNKTPPTTISQAGLYNYALSLMQYEFRKRFDEDTEKRLTEFYKPS